MRDKAEHWQRVKELFDQALQVAPGERAAFLTEHTEDAEVRAEVSSLLAAYDDSPEFLEGARPRVEPPPELDSTLAGRRIGAWKLVQEVGRGGMGVVWEVERADEAYSQRAAMKLLSGGLFSAAGIARFREERQILARLNHPSIARLFDGGTSEDGSPYLVMEYVEGEQIEVWCDRANLSMRQRVELFLAVCGAVEYAHRHLVVHRDLKPGNILVTAEGAPKLLDFGIAHLLDRENKGVTATGGLLLTPEYASPEQIRGEAAGVAGDVYSLGVLLYYLLAGRKPHQFDAGNPAEALRAICEETPLLPSAAGGHPELKGDLDAVVLKAMAKDSDSRYPSVEALAADLRAWLDLRPVSAHLEPRWRHVLKFARRKRALTAAVALAVVSLIAGTGASLWYAHDASVERARAEARFQEVRRFNSSVLFELHDAIRNLPGATPARRLLLTRATEFLDGLAKDAGDVALQVEVAEGYRRMGHVLGSSFSENLGQPEAAIASYKKAVALCERALVRSPGNTSAQSVLLGVYDDLTTATYLRNQLDQSDRWSAVHRALVKEIVARQPRDPNVRASIASSYSALGFYRAQRGDFASAKDDYGRAVEIFTQLAKEGSVTRDVRSQHAFALKRRGAILITENALDQAEECYRKALAIDDAIIAAEPGNVRPKMDRTFTLSDLGLILRKKNAYSQAAALYSEAVKTRVAASDADPSDVRALGLAASAEANLAFTYSLERRHAEAIAAARASLERRDRVVELSPQYRARMDAAGARVSLAMRLLDAAWDQATKNDRRRWLSEATAVLRQAAPMLSELTSGKQLGRVDRGIVSDFEEAQTRLRTSIQRPPR